jgi:phenylacetic acid degradation operon negative regulatory protein
MSTSAPSAKSLILDMLLAAEGRPLSARDAILACSVFSISDNSVRVALARLASASMIEAGGRGTYRLGPMAMELAGDVATWRSAEQRVRPWAGGYIAVQAGALGRSDRAALRRRSRALQMLGFRELDKGLYVRPDNLDGGVEVVRQRLYTLGLEREAIVFLASGLDADREAAARRLWDGKALSARYRKLRQQMEAWLARFAELEPDVAARESFLLGGRAIREVVFDPLLPEPLVDVAERHAFVAMVHRFDQAGRVAWQRFYEFNTGQPAAHLGELADGRTH